jgi:hypothetical protein
MSGSLDAAAILQLFEQLSAGLLERGARADIFLVGGAAMAVAYDARWAPRDLDAAFAPTETVRAVAEQIARDRQLSPDWLNDAVKGLCPVRMLMPASSSSRRRCVSTWPRRNTYWP